MASLSKLTAARRASRAYFGTLCLSASLLTVSAYGAAPLKPDDASAHYCAAVFADDVARWRTLLSMLKSNQGSPDQTSSKAVEQVAADIDRMSAHLRVASHYFKNQDDVSNSSQLLNNPDFFRGQLDIKACQEARKKANVDIVKGCLSHRKDQCSDDYFAAGSEECRRTMSCTAVFAVANTVQWTVYSLEGSGYRIAFPGQPEVMPTVNAAALKSGQSSFVTSYGDIPLGVPPVISVLRKNALELVASNKGIASLRTERDLTVQGLPAKEFVIDFLKTNTVRLSRHILAGVRVISAVYLGPHGSEDSPQAQRFINSLEVLKK